MRTLLILVAVAASNLRAQSPAPRNSHVMVSGGPGAGVLLFGGGADNAPRLADTVWSWTGTTWRPLSDAGPRSRTLPGAAFDTRRNVLTLYGGSGIGSGTRFGDTWEWDGQRWQEKNVRTPGPRDHHAVAYDEARGKVVVYGGLVGSALVGGTWTWDGVAWTMADSAFDAARGVIVLFGGGDSTSTETWTYNGSTWTRYAAPGPTPRWSAAMAWDGARQRVVLFGGGRNARPFGSLGDTWEWDGARWEQRH